MCTDVLRAMAVYGVSTAGAQVQVVDFKDRGPGAKVMIEVHVIVEAVSQRGIIIGAGGSALKALGSAARVDIEEFLGAPLRCDVYSQHCTFRCCKPYTLILLTFMCGQYPAPEHKPVCWHMLSRGLRTSPHLSSSKNEMAEAHKDPES